jgi:hypothetical protein
MVPDMKIFREPKKKQQQSKNAHFLFTPSTNSTFIDRIEKVFYQEFLTKTKLAVYCFSQEILT